MKMIKENCLFSTFFLFCLMMIVPLRSTFANLKINPMFGDNMVLQRDDKVTIWGTDKPGQIVTISFNGQEKSSTADNQGKWVVILDPMKAGGPFKMTVKGSDSTVKFKNVMVGDVWLCSGQSNMAFSFKDPQSGSILVNNADEAFKVADKLPDIRLFYIDKLSGYSQEPQYEAKGSWEVCSSKAIERFSAVAFFFGWELKKSTLKDIPIGLIDSSVGATGAEMWISKESLQANFDMKELRNGPFGHPISGCYDGMVNPVIPYGIKGVIWYQGESNAYKPDQYRKLFPLLMEEWRNKWNRKDLPFLFVQLANFAEPFDNPPVTFIELRESQLYVWKTVPNTGMVVAIDIGDSKDVHPKNKKDVGYRLALFAKGIVYGENIVYSGPVYDHMKIENNQIRLYFTYIGGGLKDKNGGFLKDFKIAGSDGVFKDAEGIIDGDTVVVRSKEVQNPLYVRYAYDADPVVELYNVDGLPASPFRTDSKL